MTQKKKRQTAAAIAAVLLLVAAFLALMWGSYSMSITEVLRTLAGEGSPLQNMAVLQIRLPRICIAIFAAAALSASGSILQTVTGNPLAEPGMIGLNAGAALAVVLFLTMGGVPHSETPKAGTVLLIPAFALLGTFCSSLLVYFLAFKKGIAPIRLILVGIGVNAGINALISYQQLTSSKGDYNRVLTWTSGSLWGSSWVYAAVIGPIVLILFLFVLAKGRTLDVLQLGPETSAGLGVRVQRESRILFFAAAFLAAAATSVAGNIAFLGLLGPQIAKRLAGPGHRWQIPVGACISAVILILADTAARNLFSPLELPVGIPISLLGVPFFIYLQRK